MCAMTRRNDSARDNPRPKYAWNNSEKKFAVVDATNVVLSPLSARQAPHSPSRAALSNCPPQDMHLSMPSKPLNRRHPRKRVLGLDVIRGRGIRDDQQRLGAGAVVGVWRMARRVVGG